MVYVKFIMNNKIGNEKFSWWYKSHEWCVFIRMLLWQYDIVRTFRDFIRCRGFDKYLIPCPQDTKIVDIHPCGYRISSRDGQNIELQF